MRTVLDVLDEFAERNEANALVSRRCDLNAPDEWSTILTYIDENNDLKQGVGKGMSPAAAIEEALEHVGVFPCLSCQWAATCDACHGRPGSPITKGGASARSI